ncbi:MAG: NAD(P)-dependent dehydrogenase (short-subunit alcohol dehydrogenase family) [Halioglobus sp.]|jgi:NAD(P)-dependent dehydrogenase (short-subunit alcohol dehydrogenase family)
MSSPVQDRVFIVTGGSGGFGLAIARSLIAQGAKVGLLGRSKSSLDTAVMTLGGGNAFGVAADVAHKEDISAAFTQIKKHFGRLDGLVNNAGVARPSTVENLVEEEVIQQIQTNFLGTVFCCQAVIPLLRGGDNPRIINISSASAWHYDEMSHLSIYASTKAAVERFTRDLRVELQSDGIGVTCIRPGGAWTKFADNWSPDALTAGLEAWAHAGTFMDTGMEVQQVGDAVAYAASQPGGVAVDLLEIRPNVPTAKGQY